MKKRIKLVNGLLELTELQQGRLILAKIIRGYCTQKELRAAMSENGYYYGIQEKTLEAFERGHREQMPIAIAMEKAEPPQVWRHYEKARNTGWSIDRIQNHRYGDLNFTGQVNLGDQLITLTSSPQIIREYPDGRRQPIRRIEVNHLERIMGKNTRKGDNPNSIIAGCDGSVTSSQYGIVSVYPIKYYRNINRANRDIGTNSAVWVEQDIQPYSIINTPSNVIVEGLIKSATLKAEGNLQCTSGIENPMRLTTISVNVGRHLHTRKIDSLTTNVGGDLIVDKEIVNAKVYCRRQLTAANINNSRVTVGNRLVAGNISGKSVIELGAPDIGKKDLLQRSSYFFQRNKKIRAVELEMQATRAVVEAGLERIAVQLRRLRGSADYDQKADIMLKRFIMSVEESLGTYLRGLENYKSIVSRHEQERVEISFLENQLRPERINELIILGQIEPGVTFISPNEVFAVREPMQNIVVRMDSLKGSLEIHPGKEIIGSVA